MKHSRNILEAARNISITSNVLFRVIDRGTGQVVQETEGHNAATNSLINGIAHHLVGDFWASEPSGLRPTYSILSNYVPRYISLGTMGLLNQEEDSDGLPAGIGDTMPDPIEHPEYKELEDKLNKLKESLATAKQAVTAASCPHALAAGVDCENCNRCTECSERVKSAKEAYNKALEEYNNCRDELLHLSEEVRFTEYIQHVPGYGADGYDSSENNGRQYMGLGYMYTSYDKTKQYHEGDVCTYRGTLYTCIKNTSTQAGVFNTDYWEENQEADQPDPHHQSIRIELSSPSFPRAQISYRDIVPEYEAELPKTIDVVFSAMISTGALKQFRPEGKDYIYITEAGLWSKNNWEPDSNNGLLAGYRIIPTDDEQMDMSVEENRQKLKKLILKVGKNQVVQVIWKIQLGSIDDIGTRTVIRTETKQEYIYPNWQVDVERAKHANWNTDDEDNYYDTWKVSS